MVLLGAQRELETLMQELDRLTRGTSDGRLSGSVGTLQEVYGNLEDVCIDLAVEQGRQDQAESCG